MQEGLICRFCESQSSAALSGRRNFTISGATPHYAPDRPFKLEHVFLDLKVDPRHKALQGTVTQKVTVLGTPIREIHLDQVSLNIKSVSVKGNKAEFRIEGDSVRILLTPPPSVGETFEFSIDYSLQNPQRGIYFTGPDSDYPQKPFQVWTQGQDQDSRYWFPTFDYPNQKATSEIRVVVPKGFTAVSNGALLTREESTEGVCFHYRLGLPQVTYLITLVIAEFSKWTDPGPRNLPIEYFVTPGREEDGKRAFSQTPKMIEVFEKKTGIPYPFEKYSQVAVQDFIFGGMENTSATTQTDLTLHDSRAHLDFSSDPLVAHELAHQWFGDLVTCRDWSHGWLNEGFATFMERVWIENRPDNKGGFEESKYYSYQNLKDYLAEDQGKYRRPIICNNYIEPIDLFDSHLYKKGGLVLNLVRYVLGEEPFWRSIQVYLTRHRGQSVETLDLIRAIEDTTGRNLRRLFDEWVFDAGYPEFEVSYQWHEERKLTEWVIEQKQTGSASSLTHEGSTTPLFHLPIVLEFTLENGKKVSHQVEISESRERVFLPSPTQPLMVRFDPHFYIPKTLKFPRPKEMLLYQLEKDLDCMGRIEAAQELAKMNDFETSQALYRQLKSDPFWGVQAEIAKLLGELKSDRSKQALEGALNTQHPKARRAIVSALGNLKEKSSADALKERAENDESYFVAADATFAWAQVQTASPFSTNPEVVHAIAEFLQSQLKKTSFREVIRAAGLNALSEIPGIGKGDYPHLLESITHWTQRGLPMDARVAALKALGKVLKLSSPPHKAQILEVFSNLSFENNFRIRVQMVSALEDAGCSEAIPILSRIRQIDTDGRVKRAAQLAMDTLAMTGQMPAPLLELKASLEKLEKEYSQLRSKLEENKTPT